MALHTNLPPPSANLLLAALPPREYAALLPHLQAEQRKHRFERLCSDELAGKTLAQLRLGDVMSRST